MVLLHAEAVHFIVFPVASVLLAIIPAIGAKALNNSILVVTGVGLPVRELLYTVAVTLVVLEVAKELCAVFIGFLSDALHDTLDELSMVSHVVHMDAQSDTVVHVIGKVAFVSLTSDHGEFTVAVCEAKIPCALIRSTILEMHGATAMTEPTKPLAIISRSRRTIAMHSHLKQIIDLLLVPESVDLDNLATIHCLHDFSHRELLRSPAVLLS